MSKEHETKRDRFVRLAENRTNKICLLYTSGLCEFLLDQFQHDRLSAAADTGHDLDKIRSDKRTDAAHIQFAFCLLYTSNGSG